jgi:cell division protein FtsB
MNVSYQDILNEYKAQHTELTYTTIAQRLAIKKLEDRVKELEAEVKEARDNALAETVRAQELQALMDQQDPVVVENE